MTEPRYQQVWRDPDEETVGLYPNLVVHDGRVSGSITVGPTRLPLWCFIGEVTANGWDGVENGWEPSKYGFTAADFSGFVYNLLEARGELGRLLLMFANANRVEDDRYDEWSERNSHPTDIDGVYEVKASPDDPDPGPWYSQRDLAEPVIAQLHRCIEAIEGSLG